MLILQVCAPHYKYFFSKFEVVEPVGTCFYATNGFENIEEFASCRQERICFKLILLQHFRL